MPREKSLIQWTKEMTPGNPFVEICNTTPFPWGQMIDRRRELGSTFGEGPRYRNVKPAGSDEEAKLRELREERDEIIKNLMEESPRQ